MRNSRCDGRERAVVSSIDLITHGYYFYKNKNQYAKVLALANSRSRGYGFIHSSISKSLLSIIMYNVLSKVLKIQQPRKQIPFLQGALSKAKQTKTTSKVNMYYVRK